MFYSISGSLIKLDTGYAVIEAGGIGYKLTVSQTTHDQMPPYLSVSEAPVVKLFTYLAVREDGIELFGFASEDELTVFKLLISVSGVGPKAAMAVLSVFDSQSLATAIFAEDTKSISKAQGVGAKTAARIILELKDKISAISLQISNMPSSKTNDNTNITGGGKFNEAVSALTGLGYSRIEAVTVLKRIDPSLPLGEMIKLSLKGLNKN